MLKIKTLEADIFKIKADNFAGFLSGIPIEMTNQQAFIELFGKLFSNRLSFDAKEIKNTELKYAVLKGNLSFISKYVKETYKLKGDIADLTLLKILHDAFYSGDFSKQSILLMLKEGYFTTNTQNLIRSFSRNVAEKLAFMMVGSSSPVICLSTLENLLKCTNSETDKFKYIIFADIEMIICREQLKYLSAIDTKFKKYLDIFIVLRKTDLKKAKEFIAANNVPGIKFIDAEGAFIEKYKVKSFPACFLFDEKHNVVFEQAKSPLDGFEQQFAAYLQRELFERLRNQNK